MPLPTPIRIGTRGSPLALAQAEQVRARLFAADPTLANPDDIAIVPIVTTGDRVQDRPLSAIGNKGLFVKEIEQALADRRIDLAVHSMKDVETWIDPRFVIAAVLPREDPRDALICFGADRIAALPAGASVGTSSLRRQAQLLALRPDLSIVTLRGNVETRIRKIREGHAAATLLALAGLKRLGLADIVAAVLDPSELLPAAAQGAIGVECRADDAAIRDRLAAIGHAESAAAVAAERALLAALDGSCRTPVGALAEPDGAGGLALRALLARPDGSRVWRVSRRSALGDAEAMGTDAGRELRAAGDRELFD